MRRPVARVAAAVGTAMLVLSACTASPRPTDSEGPPIRGGDLVHGLAADPPDLQPLHTLAPIHDAVLALLYDTPVRFDPLTGEILPNLGRWTVSADGLTYAWSIEANATWTDGRPIIAEDWLTGLRAVARSLTTTRRSNFAEIVGFNEYAQGRAPTISGVRLDPSDPKRWTVTLARVFCPALMRTSGYILPTHVFARYLDVAGDIDRAAENVAPMVTSGPFRFKEWRRADELVLVRNDRYWRGAPLLDSFIFKIVPDANTMALRLKVGELGFGTVEPERLPDITQQPQLRIYADYAVRSVHLGWNTRSQSAPALADARVRQALAYALDVDQFINTVLAGQATRIYAHHPPGSWAAPTGALERYARDPQRSETLLAQAGYTRGTDGVYARDGRRLELTIAALSSNKSGQDFVQVAIDQFRQVGVAAKARVVTPGEFNDRVPAGTEDFEGWIALNQIGPDPDPALFWGRSEIPDPAQKRRGLNWSGYTSPELEAAITGGRTPPNGDCSTAARKQHYETVNAILNRDVPYVFLWSPKIFNVANRSLRGYVPGPFTQWYLADVERWWLAR